MVEESRQAEILRANYQVFMRRAKAATEGEYRTECFTAACAAANEYHKITGKEVEE
jgi:hypothetical protein